MVAASNSGLVRRMSPTVASGVKKPAVLNPSTSAFAARSRLIPDGLKKSGLASNTPWSAKENVAPLEAMSGTPAEFRHAKTSGPGSLMLSTA